MTLRTSGGNVTVTVPRSAAFNLEADTSGGEVGVENLTLNNFVTSSSADDGFAGISGREDRRCFDCVQILAGERILGLLLASLLALR